MLNRMGRWINVPLGWMGLALVRSRARSAMPVWEERLARARDLGLAPRVVFDGGAFKGLWARQAARLFPGAKMILVEPNIHLAGEIRAQVGGLRPEPTVIHAALGAAPARGVLNIWGDPDGDTGASLLQHVAGPPGTTLDTEVETIDNIAARTGLLPDLLKLDLQGAELDALHGATRVLGHAEMVMVEFGCLGAYTGRTSPRDLIDCLYAHDYCLYDIVDCHYRPFDGALTGGDFLFVKNSSALRSYPGWR